MRAPAGNQLVREAWIRSFRLGWGAGALGAVVVFVLIGFLIPIFLEPLDGDERRRLLLLNVPIVTAAVVVAGLVLTKLATRRFKRALAWLEEGREPTEEEHRLTLRMSLAEVMRTGTAWFVAAIALGAVNLTHSPGIAALVVVTMWLGAETSSAVIYLASERIMRPITALALRARMPAAPVGPGIRTRLLFAWALGTGAPVLAVLVVGAVGATRDDVGTGYIAAAVIFLALVALSVGMLATLLAAKAISDPVTGVRRALERVERGELEVGVDVDDGSEVGLLQAGFNRMVEGLRERERIRDLFGRQVGQDVARAALREGTTLGGEEREIAALFVDLAGSTSMALAMPPAEVVRLLNLFFCVVVETVEAEGGLVNKFEGDAALCVFGAPARSHDPAGAALRAARRMATRLEAEVPEVDFGIGVSAGRAVAGNVGAEQRFEYTVIGDPVNEAARLSDLAKQRPERVMSAAAALRRAGAGESEAWQLSDSVVLRGRDEPTELASPRGTVG